MSEFGRLEGVPDRRVGVRHGSETDGSRHVRPALLRCKP